MGSQSELDMSERLSLSLSSILMLAMVHYFWNLVLACLDDNFRTNLMMFNVHTKYVCVFYTGT